MTQSHESNKRDENFISFSCMQSPYCSERSNLCPNRSSDNSPIAMFLVFPNL